MKKIMSFFIAMTLLMSTSLNVLALESDDEIILILDYKENFKIDT